MKKKSKTKIIVEWLLLAVGLCFVGLALFDYFYEPFNMNKTLSIIGCVGMVVVYFIIDWDNLK